VGGKERDWREREEREEREERYCGQLICKKKFILKKYICLYNIYNIHM
jgi:hypothetical protein